MEHFGFIITRHVNSITTNKYWNTNIKLLRKLYPLTKIVIIDDNSNYEYVKEYENYNNVIVIQSEYPKRGELLPYYYLLKYRFFENAFIIHDSIFIHKKINFKKLNGVKVIPLWHFDKYDDNINNTIRLANYLNNPIVEERLKKTLMNDFSVMPLSNHNDWYGCFGVQCYINLRFLEEIEKKYKITNLLNVVNCRKDRSSLERIFGCIFCIENNNLLLQPSLFGDIFKYSGYDWYKYTYENYVNDYITKKLDKLIVKVWTGR